MRAQQTDSAFVQFTSNAYGYRACFCILRTYIKKYKLDTLEKCIGRYAPPSENNTSAYVNKVSQTAGIPKDTKLDIYNADMMCKIVAAMSLVENGVKASMPEVITGYKIL